MKTALSFIGSLLLGSIFAVLASLFTTNTVWIIFAGVMAGCTWSIGEHFIARKA
jgi:glucose uptake protein GlcU